MNGRPLCGWPLVLSWLGMLGGSWGLIFWTATQIVAPEPACKPLTLSEYTATRSWMPADPQVINQCERYGDLHYTRKDANNL